MTEGAIRSFRGLRTGDKRSLLSGVALLTYGLWRRNRGRRELIYRKTFKPGEAVLIRANRAGRSRLVINDELSEQNKRR